MDASFCAKSQAFSAITCVPLSACSSHRTALSLRREFLGCGHKIRPPDIRSRKKCKKTQLQVYSPRFSVRASLDAQSTVLIIAVVVVTVSALTVTYPNYRRRQKNIKEISGSVNIQGHTSTEFYKDTIKDMEVSQDSDYENTQLKCEELVLNHTDTSITKGLETPGFVSVASISDSRFLEEYEDTGLSSLPYVSSELDATRNSNSGFLVDVEDAVLSSLPTLSSGLPVATYALPEEKCERHEAKLSSELVVLHTKNDSAIASVKVENVIAGVHALRKPSNAHSKAAGFSSYGDLSVKKEIGNYHDIFGTSAREELYTFYEINELARKPNIGFNNHKISPSQVRLNENNIFSSIEMSSTAKQAKVSSKNLSNSVGWRGKRPVGHEEGSPSKVKDSGLLGGKEKIILRQNSNKKLLPVSHSKRQHDEKNHHSPRVFNSFNRFLKEGRLIDCIELLECMERKGVLDMNKVYHLGFFHVCASQKAVKEAFHFTKLIPNPSMSTFNMLMSVCASSQDMDGAFQVLQLVQKAGLKVDCKLYTTLISTCAKCGKVDAMFKVFHEMVNSEVEPNVHTYGALIDGSAKAGQIAKAFGAYGIMRSKNVEPDRVVFNALITACGQSGAVDRAFDVLAEMRSEAKPIYPDYVTVGALMKACANSGKVDQAREVYDMMHEYNIKGTPEVYTIAVSSCSQTGDWEFACRVYDDMAKKGVIPDEMFISALINAAGHAGKLDSAFEILQEVRSQGIHVGIISYSSLMGACRHAKNWKKAVELYEDIKTMGLKPTVPMMNALITALCDADQLHKAVNILSELRSVGIRPNTITYSILLVASEKKDDVDTGLMLFSQAKKEGVAPNPVMFRCLIAMCSRRFEKARMLGEPLLSFNSGRVQLDSKWTSSALMVYRESIEAGLKPNTEELSLIMGCLSLPNDASLKNQLIENLGVATNTSKGHRLCSLVNGFGEYDPRAFSLLEEAASYGIIPCVSFKESPVVVDVRKLQSHLAEVYLLTIFKGLKHRLAAGAKVPHITILLPIEKTQIQSPTLEKTINLAGRVSQSIASLLRRLGLPFHGNESYGKIRINGVVLKKWFQPKLASPFRGKPADFGSSFFRLGKGISHQQRNIRTGNLSLE